MLQMAAIFHIFIGATVSGVAMIFALVFGYNTITPILIAVLAGFIVSVPITYYVAKLVYSDD